MANFLFWVFSALAIAAALTVVINKNPVYSALSLVVTLFSLASIFVLLEAYFLAALEILVYAGAIMVLFLFVIMLLNLKREETPPPYMKVQVALGVFVAILFVVFAVLSLKMGFSDLIAQSVPSTADFGDISQVGKVLFSKYFFPFEVASLLLLVALIGTVYLAKRRLT